MQTETNTKTGERRESVTFAKLIPSPLNPRKHFDDTAVAQLAESIAAQGVLQNLLVREHPTKKDHFEIISGETRWRAIDNLVKAKRLSADFDVPCAIRWMKDEEVIALALMENLQRKDLTPMEEARGFAALRKSGLSTADIAARTKVTQRQVQLRLALVDKLAPEAQRALEKGDINAHVARQLATAPAAVQGKTLKEVLRREPDERTGEAVSEILGRASIAMKMALFDIKLYTDAKGAVITNDETGAVTHFTDEKLFKQLQQAHVDAKVADLKKAGQAKIQVLGNSNAGVKTSGYFSDHDWHKNPKSPNACTIIEIVNDWQKGASLKLHEHMVEGRAKGAGNGPAAKTGKAAKANPLDNFTQPHIEYVSVRKSHALQLKTATDATLAMRLAIIAMLGAGGNCVELPSRRSANTLAKDVFDKISAALGALPKSTRTMVLDQSDDKTTPTWGSVEPLYEDDIKAVWSFVFDLKPAALQTLFTQLVAANVRAPAHMTGDTDEVLAFTKHVKVDPLKLKLEDLEGLRKDALMGLCRQLKATFKDNMTGAQLRDLIKAELKKKPTDYVLPTLRFGDEDALAKAAKQLLGG
jgi:ParB/RepB/Spo0J family partition protein